MPLVAKILETRNFVFRNITVMIYINGLFHAEYNETNSVELYVFYQTLWPMHLKKKTQSSYGTKSGFPSLQTNQRDGQF